VAGVIRTTPFHPRLRQLNTQGLYTHWQGHLSALRYTHAPKHEYFAVRNAVGIFDTSPLFKYRIHGPDAERFLAGVLVRDIRCCRPGHAQYTLWCDDRGFVMEDGVVFRQSATDFLLTAARPTLSWFADLARRMQVDIDDVSDEYGILAVQGPRSRAVLSALVPEAGSLPFFGLTRARIGSAAVTLSRTGYTGDLGFEVTVKAGPALEVLDAILEVGRDHGLRPFGEEALMMLRIEAGLPLVDVEWTNSRLAFTDRERVTPVELGMRWMLRGVSEGTRAFVGGTAIRRELARKTSRWASVGVVVDWGHWDRLHRAQGLVPPKDERPSTYESVLHDRPTTDGSSEVGYVTSFMYSPVLQRHIGLARVRPDLAVPGTEVHLELTLNHSHTTVAARTAKLPLFNPARRTASQ
jgi:glycine cleavage system T protein (aminomethyltransferase)